MRMLKQCVLAVAALMVLAVPLSAQGGYIDTDRLGYTGSIYRYGSLADALAGTNAVSGSPFAVPARDLSLYMVNNNAAFGTAMYANSMIYLSNWYANGGNSPSNQNTGFIQNYDIDGASVTSMSMVWDQTMTTFSLAVSGGNGVSGCISPGDCGRLWNAGSALGAASTTGGIFHSYMLTLTASGLTQATYNPTTMVYESVSNPTSVSGMLTGIFENTGSDAASHGWYAYSLAINEQSWAVTNGYATTSTFGSAMIVTPEPASMILVATGLLGMAVANYRRRKKKALE